MVNEVMVITLNDRITGQLRQGGGSCSIDPNRKRIMSV